MVNRRLGPVSAVGEWFDHRYVVSQAQVPGVHASHHGYGAAECRATAHGVALLESLERMASESPQKSRVTRGTFSDLRAKGAINPNSLGLHSPEQYALPGFLFSPFDVHRDYDWVEAYSLTEDRRKLVPASYAFYEHASHLPASERFVYEVSNGCAVGSTYEEAILHGLLEVVERDAFLLWWYSQTRVQEIKVPRKTLAGYRQDTGMNVRVFDITTEFGIPVALTVGVAAGREVPKIALAAGAHLDFNEATKRALSELAGTSAGVRRRLLDHETAERARMLSQRPTSVTEMEDHSLLFSTSYGERALAFQLHGAPRYAGVDGRAGGRHETVTDGSLTGRIGKAGLEVIIVDQTTEVMSALNLRCVKVIVPGCMPMTFGHQHARLEGIPRLLRAPRILKTSLSQSDGKGRPVVHRMPHPFP